MCLSDPATDNPLIGQRAIKWPKADKNKTEGSVFSDQMWKKSELSLQCVVLAFDSAYFRALSNRSIGHVNIVVGGSCSIKTCSRNVSQGRRRFTQLASTKSVDSCAYASFLCPTVYRTIELSSTLCVRITSNCGHHSTSHTISRRQWNTNSEHTLPYYTYDVSYNHIMPLWMRLPTRSN